jgi:hypothetical protein
VFREARRLPDVDVGQPHHLPPSSHQPTVAMTVTTEDPLLRVHGEPVVLNPDQPPVVAEVTPGHQDGVLPQLEAQLRLRQTGIDDRQPSPTLARRVNPGAYVADRVAGSDDPAEPKKSWQHGMQLRDRASARLDGRIHQPDHERARVVAGEVSQGSGHAGYPHAVDGRHVTVVKLANASLHASSRAASEVVTLRRNIYKCAGL